MSRRHSNRLREISRSFNGEQSRQGPRVSIFAYDAENRPVTVRSNGVTVAAYAYDHLGRRVRKATPSATHIYHYDGWNLVREIQWPVASGQWPVGSLATSNCPLATIDYVWGKDLSGSLSGAGGVGGLLAVIVSDCPATNSQLTTYNSQLYFPTYDANGNVTAYVSETGTVVAQYAYDGFGRTLSASGPDFFHNIKAFFTKDDTNTWKRFTPQENSEPDKMKDGPEARILYIWRIK